LGAVAAFAVGIWDVVTAQGFGARLFGGLLLTSGLFLVLALLSEWRQ
jgi:hypothetical protein